MATSPQYSRGFEAGKQEAARITLDALADHAHVVAGRLGGFPDAVSAANEAAAILRDAAKELEYVPPTPPKPSTSGRRGSGEPAPKAVRRDPAPSQGLVEQREPDPEA